MKTKKNKPSTEYQGLMLYLLKSIGGLKTTNWNVVGCSGRVKRRGVTGHVPDTEVDGQVEGAVDQHEQLDQLLYVQVPDTQVPLTTRLPPQYKSRMLRNFIMTIQFLSNITVKILTIL